jgi:hypothetical protein
MRLTLIPSTRLPFMRSLTKQIYPKNYRESLSGLL